MSTQAGSDPFRRFSALLDFSTGYKENVLIGYDQECLVLTMELLQFYYSRSGRLLGQLGATDFPAGTGLPLGDFCGISCIRPGNL